MTQIGQFFQDNNFIRVYVDDDNYRKFWLVKQNGSHYYYKQMIDAVNSSCYINNRLVGVYDSRNVNNTKWIRTTKKHLLELDLL